ncbi:MAG: (E)-4-hydroxy-3-methylbut-2-enyl-diphosphate synthase [Muribaculaceae bacterium]|nr:(E)-4-hydroxy-3-methylbut-2-enyl-diphosphate synthase [Muribaculaceae bacterium]
MNNFNYQRRKTVTVNIGNTPLGSDFPIRVQSMTNTSTNDIEASVEQCQRIADAGAQYVRLTTQGVREAKNLGIIRQQLRERGCEVPLVADIHFNPRAALEAAKITDKVRINPGNFVDPARQFKSLSYTDEEYQAELHRIHDSLVPFIDLCRKHGTAVRLGVNHGSLSDRIMSRYGNTAPGMVESVMEYLRVFVEQNFMDVAISMKASNVVVMVEAVRRLVAAMEAEDMHFPLHLGVTEAGFGEDGRIKSAVGIGALMSQGLGDTIRVSLSEDPELEVPVANKLVEYISNRENHPYIEGHYSKGYNPLMPRRRICNNINGLVGSKAPIVIASCRPEYVTGNRRPDFFFSKTGALNDSDQFIVPAAIYSGEDNTTPLFSLDNWDNNIDAPVKWLEVPASTPIEKLLSIKDCDNVALIISPDNINVSGCQQALIHAIIDNDIHCPVILHNGYLDTDSEWLQVKAGADLGAVLLNGLGDGVWLEDPDYEYQNEVVGYAFAILQAARLRTTKTEFISCPSCGRTMFDLQTTVRRVQEATQHLTHLKIGVMGCVVNGPGEMADADYGYVGAAVGKISLYKGKECIEKNIPEADAIPHLIALIKENGDWKEPNSNV